MTSEEININKEIIDRCKNGETKAQFLLYKQYSKAMYNIAIRFLNNKMDAEDILQESFVTAFERMEELSSYSAFGSWLKRITINNCISYLRRKRLEFEEIREDLQEENSESNETDFNVDPVLVHDAIKKLPSGGRTVLILHALEGFKHREIAEILGISESTSKSQYKRAIDLLFIQLKEKAYAG